MSNPVQLGQPPEVLWALEFGDGGTRVVLGAEMTTIDEIGSLTKGPAHHEWRVRVGNTSTPWPEGYRLESPSRPGKEPYVFVQGSGGTTIVIPEGTTPDYNQNAENVGLALSGYRVRFQPALGFSAVRLGPNNAPRPDSVKIGTSKGFVIIVPGHPDGGGTEVRSGDEETPPGMIGKIEVVPTSQQWTIDTGRYTCVWPRGMGVNSTGPSDAWPFEIYGLEDSKVFVRGPLKGIPPASTPWEMVGKGQAIVGQKRTSNGMSLELEYEHGGRTWHQRHHWVGFPNQTMMLVTGQAPKELFPRLDQAMEEVVSSLFLAKSAATSPQDR